MHMRSPSALRHWQSPVTGLLLLLPVLCAAAPPIWTLERAESTIRIAGSVHYLRESDYPLPEVLERAYRQADVLVVEYDTHEEGMPIRATALSSRVPRPGRLRTPGPLRRSMSTPEFTELRRLAEERGFDVFRLDRIKPWFAGMYVVEKKLAEAGFDPDLGVDNHLIDRAYDEDKPVMGLETAAEQREMFQSIPKEEQVDFLFQSLRSAPRIPSSMEKVVARWRAGDIAWLEDALLRDLKANPTEYERFSTRRNLRWADQLEALVDTGRNYLVVVGVMHLLGEQSLISLLEERGYQPTRWPKAVAAGGEAGGDR